MEHIMETAGLIPLDVNVEMIHLDKDGNVKPIFQESKVCRYLNKHDWLSPLWINQWYSFALSPLLGFWAEAKVYKNLVTDAGKAAVASRINGSGGAAAFTAIGQGTGTTSAAA